MKASIGYVASAARQPARVFVQGRDESDLTVAVEFGAITLYLSPESADELSRSLSLAASEAKAKGE